MVLDATVAGASANSYLTVAEADALADQQGLGRALKRWLEAHFDDKERALIRATHEVDAYIGTATRWAEDQALLFPRLTDVDGLDMPFIIPNVRLATYEQALYVLHNADQIDAANTRRARGLIQFADDDGSGSVVAIRQDFGAYSQQALAYLNAVRLKGRGNLFSVPVKSSYQ